MTKPVCVQLRTKPRGGDLDGYIFEDGKHALVWLRQAFVTDDEYQIAMVHVKPAHTCPTCGSWVGVEATRTIQLMSVSEYLDGQRQIVKCRAKGCSRKAGKGGLYCWQHADFAKYVKRADGDAAKEG